MLDDISSITISKSSGYGGINENYIATIDKDAIISRFEEACKYNYCKVINIIYT